MSSLNKPAQLMESFQKGLSEVKRIMSTSSSFEKAFKDERRRVANDFKELNSFRKGAARTRAEEIMNGVKASKSKVASDFEKMGYTNPNTMEEMATNANDIFERMLNKADNYTNLRTGKLSDAESFEQAGRITVNAAKDYFDPRREGALKRAGILGGLYAASAIGTRYANGGTLTRNSDGEDDIAGIPFI